MMNSDHTVPRTRTGTSLETAPKLTSMFKNRTDCLTSYFRCMLVDVCTAYKLSLSLSRTAQSSQENPLELPLNHNCLIGRPGTHCIKYLRIMQALWASNLVSQGVDLRETISHLHRWLPGCGHRSGDKRTSFLQADSGRPHEPEQDRNHQHP